jgi:hypothetical protein
MAERGANGDDEYGGKKGCVAVPRYDENYWDASDVPASDWDDYMGRLKVASKADASPAPNNEERARGLASSRRGG